jgi:hypothetical protein
VAGAEREKVMKRKELLESQGVSREDVDDVVDIATELMSVDDAAKSKLSLEEMKELGEELDIPAEYIEKAQSELTRRRQEKKLEEAQAQASRNRLIKIASLVLAGLFLVFAILIMGKTSGLNAAYEKVEKAAAQMKNVQARKLAITEMYKNRPDSMDKDAELVGAENRIRVETKRHAEAAAEYNKRARGFLAGMAAALSGLPSKVEVGPKE